MNLLDSHDTERLLWTLTPGAETTAGERTTPANVAAGKRRCGSLRCIQFTVPGAPTVYYGDEVGRDRRRRPGRPAHLPVGRPGRHARHRAARALHGAGRAARRDPAALRDGDFRVLLADDAAETVALRPQDRHAGRDRRVNRSGVARTRRPSRSPATLPDGTSFARRFVVGDAGRAASP